MFRRELQSHIEIDASPGRVWTILTDFESFPDWNPFVRKISGALKVGSTMEVRNQPPGRGETRFKPRILTVEPNHQLRWLGRLGMPLVFDGEHTWSIERIGADRVRFTQKEKFSGILVPLLRGLIDDTQRGFDSMNKALKDRAERKPG